MRLVERIHRLLEHVRNTWLDVHDREPTAVAVDQRLREMRFICVSCPRSLVTSREGVRGCAGSSHAGEDCGRIETAAKQHGHRYVTHEMRVDRLIDPPEHILRTGLRAIGMLRHIPITLLDRGAVVFPDEHMAGRQLPHADKRRVRRWDVTKSEIRFEGAPIELMLDHTAIKQRFQLRRENNLCGCSRNVERLDSEAITREQQRAFGLIPKRKCKHAAQVLDAVSTVIFVQMNDGFGIAVGAKAMTALYQV